MNPGHLICVSPGGAAGGGRQLLRLDESPISASRTGRSETMHAPHERQIQQLRQAVPHRNQLRSRVICFLEPWRPGVPTCLLGKCELHPEAPTSNAPREVTA